MPKLPFRLTFIRQAIGDRAELSSFLSFPELSRLNANDAKLDRAMQLRAAEILRDVPAFSQYQMTTPADIQVASTTLKIVAPQKQYEWYGEFQMPVQYVWWEVDSRHTVAYIPSMGVRAIAVGNGQIDNEVRRETRNALTRYTATTKLPVLSWFAEFGSLQLESDVQEIDIPSPRQLADKEKQNEEKNKTLKQVAQPVHPKQPKPAYLVEKQVKQLADRLSSRRVSSVLLVGPSGVGKTAIFGELVRRQNELGMGDYHFWKTDGSQMVAGMSGFGQWQQRCTDLLNEIDKEKVIIHFGNLVELVEAGRGGSIQQGIADFLRPHLVRGKLQAIAECTTEQLSLLNKQSPYLLDAFNQIHIAPKDTQQSAEILLEVASNELPKNSNVEPAAIAAINQLHARFATYSAMPGRAVRFLRQLGENFRLEPTTIDADLVTQKFADETGLPAFLLRDSENLNLAETTEWFKKRIIGQQEPVDLVVDLLAVVKSSLNRPGRPIASLMFIGPTGVGKTEMAKALAEFMYRDPKRMVRFDMSEYKDPYSAARLIGGMGDSDGLLTSKVRENPFTVVLLDEFEKAHPAVFDLFLQVLGEGRLTDGFGRTVDFSTCVVIMTSNLGVESFREVSLGFNSEKEGEQTNYREHFIRKVRQHVRPEFFNRIDRVVPFAPLSKEAVEKIASRELELLQRRHGIANRNITFKFHKSAAAALAELGYDARYGARPLKRTINDKLVQPLAAALNERANSVPLKVNVHAQQSGIHFSVDASEGNPTNVKKLRSEKNIVATLSSTRRRAQATAKSPTATKLRNELYRHEQTLRRKLKGKSEADKQATIYRVPELLERQLKIDKLNSTVGLVDQLLESLIQYEQETINGMLVDEPIDSDGIHTFAKQTDGELDKIILELFLANTGGEKRANLFAFSRYPKFAKILIDSWIQVAQLQDLNHNIYELRRHSQEERVAINHLKIPSRAEIIQQNNLLPDDKQLPIYSVDLFSKLSEEPPKDLIGYAINIEGPAAFQIFLPEQGMHRFRQSGTKEVLVEATGQVLTKFVANQDAIDLTKFDQSASRRTYDIDDQTIKDYKLDASWKYDGPIEEDIAEVVDSAFKKLLNSQIDSWT